LITVNERITDDVVSQCHQCGTACDVYELRERRLSFALFSVMLAKKNVRLLFYRMCYHYSLAEEEQKPFEEE
jgi:hypothetical protein